MKLLQRRCDTMALTSRVRIAVCLALWQHPCPLRLLRRHLSQSERLWHSVTFFSKRKSVSSKTKPLCQGLPCQGSCRADARLRGWIKDAFSVSGITQVLLCTTSPSSSLCSMPPPLIRGGFAAVKFYRNTVCYCETKSLCQWLPFSGELSSGCETERLCLRRECSITLPRGAS